MLLYITGTVDVAVEFSHSQIVDLKLDSLNNVNSPTLAMITVRHFYSAFSMTEKRYSILKQASIPSKSTLPSEAVQTTRLCN